MGSFRLFDAAVSREETYARGECGGRAAFARVRCSGAKGRASNNIHAGTTSLSGIAVALAQSPRSLCLSSCPSH